MPKSMTSMRQLLSPRSIAIVGVSSQETGFAVNGRTVLKHLLQHKYDGTIVPIHARESEILGLPTVPSLDSLEAPVDCAVIAVASDQVLEQLHMCVRVGIKAAVILASGFAELDESGTQRQLAITRFASEHDMVICGPNTTGYVRTANGLALNATSSLQSNSLIKGNLALVAQSGALGGALLDKAFGQGIGLSYLIGTGNEAVLDVSDYIEYLIGDDETTAIGVYVEAIRNMSRFLDVAKLAREVGKPIVVFKVGRTEAGAKAAASHTGALAGNYDTFAAIMRGHGVTVADSLDGLIGTSLALAQGRRPAGSNVGIFTFSGALGSVVTDALVERGLSLSSFDNAAIESIRTVVGESSLAVHNPLDSSITKVYQGSKLRDLLGALGQDSSSDIVIVVMMPLAPDRTDLVVESLIALRDSTSKPVLVCWYGQSTSPGIMAVRATGIPCFNSIEQCASAAEALANDATWERINSTTAISPVNRERKEKALEILADANGPLSEWDSRSLLELYGVRMCESWLVTDEKSAAEAAHAANGPFALKVLSPDLPHKARVGGVQLGIGTPAEASEAFRAIVSDVKVAEPSARILGCIMQPMISADLEVMIGVKIDPDSGAVVVVGPGGGLTELLGGHAIAAVPRAKADALAAIRRSSIGRVVLAGGEQSPLAEHVIEMILAIGDLAAELGDRLVEIEINPIRVRLSGDAQGVDALVIAGEGPASQQPLSDDSGVTR